MQMNLVLLPVNKIPQSELLVFDHHDDSVRCKFGILSAGKRQVDPRVWWLKL